MRYIVVKADAVYILVSLDHGFRAPSTYSHVEEAEPRKTCMPIYLYYTGAIFRQWKHTHIADYLSPGLQKVSLVACNTST
jgi:hypothetical protein